MKETLLALLISAPVLLGDTYVAPTTKDVEQSSKLVVIGSIESIEMTHKSEYGVDFGLSSAREVKEEITILIHSILRGEISEEKIKLSHVYYELEPHEKVQARIEEINLIIKQMEALGDLYAAKHEDSELFEDSKEAVEIVNKVDILQMKVDRLLDPSSETLSPDITDSWHPPETDEFLIFLNKEGDKYTIPFGRSSFRKLSHLTRSPKHSRTEMTEPVGAGQPDNPPVKL